MERENVVVCFHTGWGAWWGMWGGVHVMMHHTPHQLQSIITQHQPCDTTQHHHTTNNSTPYTTPHTHHTPCVTQNAHHTQHTHTHTQHPHILSGSLLNTGAMEHRAANNLSTTPWSWSLGVQYTRGRGGRPSTAPSSLRLLKGGGSICWCILVPTLCVCWGSCICVCWYSWICVDVCVYVCCRVCW